MRRQGTSERPSGRKNGRALEEEQSGEMKAQSVVARNGGHRGWRHEEAVTVPTKEERESASVVAGGGGHRGRVAA